MRRDGAWYAAGLAFSVGMALVLAQVGFARAGLWSIAAAVVGGAGLWVWHLHHSVPREQVLSAQLAETLAPELGTAATSAVDLARRLDDGAPAFSHDLALRHLDLTAARLEQVDLGKRLHSHEAAPWRRTLWVVAGCALWLLLLLVLLNGGRSRLLALLLDPNAASFSDIPLAGDIQITYRYPSYTGLPQRVVEGGDGSILAVTGTEVEIKAVVDFAVRSAMLRVTDPEGKAQQDIPMHIEGDRNLTGKLSVLRDARYHFALEDSHGDLREERQSHPIRAILDAFPEVNLDSPVTDIELRDDQTVDILWRAKDDFGVAEVVLVIERPGATEPERIQLVPAGENEARREGRYRWSVAEMSLPVGAAISFFLEAIDNDVISGPKKSVSTTRRLSLFSARRNHEELLNRQRELLNALVDWLAADLESPYPQGGSARGITDQEKILRLITGITETTSGLIADLYDDRFSKPEIAVAFTNLLENIEKAQRDRLRALLAVRRPNANAWAHNRVATTQGRAVKQLEKDIIYLDDLLALQRIDELKETAKDLLAAQRNLQDLLQKYRETQDPALRAALDQQIRQLREQMVSLLAKMASIKENLPGEYRNMEAASMLKLDDQLDRLEQMLKEGDLEAAARELERLANMLENMVNSINEAEQKFGGERYNELRQQLAEFAAEFQQLESQQKALSQRADKMLKQYRKEAIRRAGKNLEAFVEKARAKTAEALEAIDEIAELEDQARAPRVGNSMHRDVNNARQRLFDLDALLESHDFSEARDMAQLAYAHSESVDDTIERQLQLAGQPLKPALRDARKASQRALERTGEVNDMLDKLFPDPSEVLTPQQMAQLQRMAKKQQSVRDEAQRLGQKMDQLAGEMPLFGGAPRQSLNNARSEMGKAVGSIQSGELPGAALHKRRAADELGKLRQAFEEASKGGQGGMPLPLGMGSGRGRGSGNQGRTSREEVEIPPTDRNRAVPRFRKDLIEAAKQKPPQRYEEAVRRYYEELIR